MAAMRCFTLQENLMFMTGLQMCMAMLIGCQTNSETIWSSQGLASQHISQLFTAPSAMIHDYKAPSPSTCSSQPTDMGTRNTTPHLVLPQAGVLHSLLPVHNVNLHVCTNALPSLNPPPNHHARSHECTGHSNIGKKNTTLV